MSAATANSLADYSTAALTAELRRREQCGSRRGAIAPCDECAHFRPLQDGEREDDYNPCQLGHVMLFRTPRGFDPYSEIWGFYRPGCRDRKRTDGAARQ